MKKQSTEWEKIFAYYTTDRGLISGIYKELQKLNNSKRNNAVKKEMSRHYSKV